jgi:hypothetical protein
VAGAHREAEAPENLSSKLQSQMFHVEHLAFSFASRDHLTLTPSPELFHVEHFPFPLESRLQAEGSKRELSIQYGSGHTIKNVPHGTFRLGATAGLSSSALPDDAFPA